jgi:hypothetical protein
MTLTRPGTALEGTAPTLTLRRVSVAESTLMAIGGSASRPTHRLSGLFPNPLPVMVRTSPLAAFSGLTPVMTGTRGGLVQTESEPMVMNWSLTPSRVTLATPPPKSVTVAGMTAP